VTTRERTKAELRTLCTGYARLYSGHAGVPELFARLADDDDDDRMVKAWQTFCKHARGPDGRPRQGAAAALMRAIAEAWGAARCIRDLPKAQHDIEAERDRLIKCAETLRALYLAWAGPEPTGDAGPPGQKIPPVRGPWQREMAMVAACEAMIRDIQGVAAPMLEQLVQLPNSRQRNKPVAFALMVGNAIEKITGKPLDGVVATITSVARREIDTGAVKQARLRARKRRSA
jgi:hypothetical protein